MQNKILLKNCSGSSTIEFIVALPILMLLFLLVLELNNRMESKQDLAIASRNLAAQNLISSAVSSLQKDYLSSTANDNNAVHTPTANIRGTQNENYAQGVYRDRIKQSLSSKDSGSTVKYSTISSFEGHLASLGHSILHFVKVDFAIGEKRLFIDDKSRLYKVDSGQTEPSRLDAGIDLMARLMTEDAIDKEDTQAWRWLADNDVRAVYARAANGYHTNEYHYHTLLGFALGMFGDQKHWGDPAERKSSWSTITHKFEGKNRGFQPDCMMHFMGGSDCVDINWLAMLMRMGYQIVGIAKLIPVIGQALTAGGVAANQATEKAMDIVGAQVKNFVTQTVKEQTEKLGAETIEEMPFFKSLTNIETELKESSAKNLKENFSGKLK